MTLAKRTTISRTYGRMTNFLTRVYSTDKLIERLKTLVKRRINSCFKFDVEPLLLRACRFILFLYQ